MSLVPQGSSQSSTHMHGKDAAGDELSMLADAEMPRLYPHHVVKHELQVEPPLHTHLARVQGQEEPATPPAHSGSPGKAQLHTGTPPTPTHGLPLPAMRLGTTQVPNSQGISAKRGCCRDG